MAASFIACRMTAASHLSLSEAEISQTLSWDCTSVMCPNKEPVRVEWFNVDLGLKEMREGVKSDLGVEKVEEIKSEYCEEVFGWYWWKDEN